MANIADEVIIEAPADAVWEVLAHRFDRIGEWASGVPASTASAGVVSPVGAPVTGRVCSTGRRILSVVEERIVAYDEAKRTLTYEASGMPEFVKTARNRWHVQALDDRRSRVSFEGTLEPRGIFGRLLYVLLRPWLARLGTQTLNDLAHYVEHGEPSPRKQRQLRAAKR